MRPGDMEQIEQEISEAKDDARCRLLAVGAFILASNLVSTTIGVFVGFLVWGI